MPRMSKPRAAPVVQDRPGRWRVLFRRQRRLLAPAGASLAFLFVLAAGVALLHLFGQGDSLRERLGRLTAELGLRVQDVVIEGRQKTPEPLLRAAIGAIPGAPILTYSVAAARANVERIQWVASATVARRLPGTIVVQIVERRPFAVWQHDDRFVLIDRDGQTVTDENVGSFAKELLLVVGSGAPAAAAGLIDALAAQPDIQARVKAAVRVGERRWNLRLNNDTDVLLPEGADVAALARLAELQQSHALLDRPLQVIDLRLPDRFAIRAQPAHGADGRTDAKEAPPGPPAARKPT
jgi:cell division protein FtsQ